MVEQIGSLFSVHSYIGPDSFLHSKCLHPCLLCVSMTHTSAFPNSTFTLAQSTTLGAPLRPNSHRLSKVSTGCFRSPRPRFGRWKWVRFRRLAGSWPVQEHNGGSTALGSHDPGPVGIPYGMLGLRETDQSGHHEVWIHLLHVNARLVDRVSREDKHRRPISRKRNSPYEHSKESRQNRT